MQWSTISIFCNFSFRFAITPRVPKSLVLSKTVKFSFAWKYLHVPPSVIFRENPNARLTLAARLSCFYTWSNFTLRTQFLVDDIAKSRIVCLLSQAQNQRGNACKNSALLSVLPFKENFRIKIGFPGWLLLCFHTPWEPDKSSKQSIQL